ncbi:hypothetical protein COB11_06710 [Candidatus Aerophobetes bacterium]|uniref:Sulfotransferase domain-containing protein n=1 Tax=Aerophobetes bacterium TaxID=2030807 RepID=A0A2A4YD28_UNCAE|nr:MAG: hypothetical protein COB11_06710 [Candidatus Aerophobetes bacterium]
MKPIEELFVLTIPKSGSHLILKCIKLLEKNLSSFPYVIRVGHPGFVGRRAPGPSKLFSRLSMNPKAKKILNIRDLRDCYCSAIPYLDKLVARKQSFIFDKIWTSLETSEQKLLYLLKLDHPMPWDLTLTFQAMVELSSGSNVLISRFEELVGPSGGGTRSSQLNLISEIVTFLELECSKEIILRIADNLFGGKRIKNPKLFFHEGKIGKWKLLFNEEHKNIFKERAGRYLIFFGYESDCSW